MSTKARRKEGRDRASATRWILLLPQVPSESSNARVRVWRRLQSIGALMLKNAVWVLPSRDECVEAFQWVAREIEAQGGQASLCEGQFFDGVSDDEIERRFSETRNEEYGAIAAEARALGKALRAKKSSLEKKKAAEAQLVKLKRRLADVIAIDWCSASGRESAEGLVVELDALASSRPAAVSALAPIAKPKGATWVTRKGVHVDRIASAWLIRAFIDADATLKFVQATGYVPEPGELRFDMYDAEFTHVGALCTFEVLLERFGIDDPGLHVIAEIVHDIDLKDEKFGRAETAGIRALVRGICTAHREDEARIALGSAVLEALRAVFLTQSFARKEGGSS